jgi:hypothetical protein
MSIDSTRRPTRWVNGTPAASNSRRPRASRGRSDAEAQSPFGDAIHRGDELGEDQRVPERRQQHGRAHGDPRRAGGDGGQQRERLETRPGKESPTHTES